MKDVKNLLNPTYSSNEFSSLMESSLNGLKQYYLIMAAWDIGIFDHTVTAETSHDIAQELGYSEIMINMFCEALADIGLLKRTNGAYINSQMASSYLCRSSPHCMTQTIQNMKANVNRWAQLANILKNGPMVRDKKDMFGDGWLISIAEWAEVSSVSSAVNVITTHINLQHWRRLLDVGGGHGLYSIAFTALNPHLETFVFDLPRVIPLTIKYIEEYDAKRVHTLSGDFYKGDIGQDYDALFSSFNPSCTDPALIPKLVQALKPGGDVILRRFKDAAREGALKTLDWNLQSFEGKKIGSKTHSSDDVIDRETYVRQLEKARLAILDIVSVDDSSEIIFARKPSGNGSEP